MKTQLTAEESAKLIELGVSPERASEIYIDAGEHGKFSIPKATSMMLECAHEAKIISPIFNIGDLLALLPKSIEHGGYAEAKLNIYTRPHRRECWVAKYIVSAKTIPYDGAGDELIDALYEVLYKLLDNHVKLD